MTDIDKLLSDCLFFTANKLTRIITKMAEEEFLMTGLSPTYAFLINIVNERPGIGQKDLCKALHLKPSTITRFVDKLIRKELVTRETVGKFVYIHPTEKSFKLQDDIDKAWHNLYKRYSDVLGYDEGDKLTAYLDLVGDKLEGE